MHAVSDNLINWKKVPEDTFFAPESQYEMNDWRDPFVFFNDEKREYWMLWPLAKRMAVVFEEVVLLFAHRPI
jgi:sucrose-6-phosphate hydrolase SacC (GH32 family)